MVAAALADRIVAVGPSELARALGFDGAGADRGPRAATPAGLPSGGHPGGRRRASSPTAPSRRTLLLKASPRETWVGVDEAGRGPLAGPVVACALVLPDPPPQGLADSKALSLSQRLRLARELLTAPARLSVAIASHAVVDALNIHRATLAAMARAVGHLEGPFDCVWVDGPHRLDLPETCHQHAAVDADALVACVAGASVVAKVVRDRIMEALDARYPGYAFALHKGYPTRTHRQALARLGPSPVHRRSFMLTERRASGL